MTISPTRLRQILMFSAAAVLLGTGFAMHTPSLPGSDRSLLNAIQEENHLALPNNEVQENHPELVLLETMPGGLRAIAVNYLWIRAEELKQDGKYHESRQLARMICNLMPRQPGVWGYHAWNNAFNISVATHTPEERYLWVTDGVRLLRDEGIPLNPRTLELYKELGWIFWMKMGGQLDDMHMAYKSRWAGEMQYVLGAPPLGTVDQVVAAFKPIADMPLDKTISRQGAVLIQPGPLVQMMLDADVAAYVQALRAAGLEKLATTGGKVEEDWKAELGLRSVKAMPRTFLAAYYRYSLDDAVQSVRLVRPALKDEDDRRFSAVINDPQHKAGRDKLLAFLRAQILWNAYRMDPSWMLEMMQLYGPMDWRSVQSHALYWITRGFHVYTGQDLRTIATSEAAAAEYQALKEQERTNIINMNSERILFNSLKDLTWYGRVTLLEDQEWIERAPGVRELVPSEFKPDTPVVIYTADYRFIEPLAKIQDETIRAVIAKERQKYEDNIFRAGHINYMVSAIRLLYMSDHVNEAQKLYDRLKSDYKLKGEAWDKDLDGMLVQRLSADGGKPIVSEGTAQVTAALVSSLSYRAIGTSKQSQERALYYLRAAETIYKATNKDAPTRVQMAPIEFYAMAVARNLLIAPEVYGMRMDLMDRSKLWKGLPEDWRKQLFDTLSGQLREQCQQHKLPFETTFPEPPGMKQFREEYERAMQQLGAPQGR